MRALLDTNIYISYLLPSTWGGPIQSIVEAAVEGAFTLLIPTHLVREFSVRVATKKYLAQRILPQDAEQLMGILARVAEIIPEITDAIPAATRDPKDDYLLAYALVSRADYLVTGDEDLLVLGEVGCVRIVRPADFLQALREATRRK